MICSCLRPPLPRPFRSPLPTLVLPATRYSTQLLLKVQHKVRRHSISLSLFSFFSVSFAFYDAILYLFLLPGKHSSSATVPPGMMYPAPAMVPQYPFSVMAAVSHFCYVCYHVILMIVTFTCYNFSDCTLMFLYCILYSTCILTMETPLILVEAILPQSQWPTTRPHRTPVLEEGSLVEITPLQLIKSLPSLDMVLMSHHPSPQTHHNKLFSNRVSRD